MKRRFVFERSLQLWCDVIQTVVNGRKKMKRELFIFSCWSEMNNSCRCMFGKPGRLWSCFIPTEIAHIQVSIVWNHWFEFVPSHNGLKSKLKIKYFNSYLDVVKCENVHCTNMLCPKNQYTYSLADLIYQICLFKYNVTGLWLRWWNNSWNHFFIFLYSYLYVC